MASGSATDPASASRARRVLVIDDDAEFADTVAAILEAAKLEVLVAYSASDALAALDGFIPDVAIVDVRMPIVDGYALLAIFRAEPRLRACTFVGISGYTSDDLGEHGFDHFFRKPFDTNTVLSALKIQTH